MRRFTMLLVAATLAVPSLTITAQTVMTQKGFLKSSVADFEEPERSKMLAFLDSCRKVSDAVIKDLMSGDMSNATKVASPAAAAQWTEVATAFKSVRQNSPSTTLQYRNQALELIGTERFRHRAYGMRLRPLVR